MQEERGPRVKRTKLKTDEHQQEGKHKHKTPCRVSTSKSVLHRVPSMWRSQSISESNTTTTPSTLEHIVRLLSLNTMQSFATQCQTNKVNTHFPSQLPPSNQQTHSNESNTIMPTFSGAQQAELKQREGGESGMKMGTIMPTTAAVGWRTVSPLSLPSPPALSIPCCSSLLLSPAASRSIPLPSTTSNHKAMHTLHGSNDHTDHSSCHRPSILSSLFHNNKTKHFDCSSRQASCSFSTLSPFSRLEMGRTLVATPGARLGSTGGMDVPTTTSDHHHTQHHHHHGETSDKNNISQPNPLAGWGERSEYNYYYNYYRLLFQYLRQHLLARKD